MQGARSAEALQSGPADGLLLFEVDPPPVDAGWEPIVVIESDGRGHPSVVLDVADGTRQAIQAAVAQTQDVLPDRTPTEGTSTPTTSASPPDPGPDPTSPPPPPSVTPPEPPTTQAPPTTTTEPPTTEPPTTVPPTTEDTATPGSAGGGESGADERAPAEGAPPTTLDLPAP